MEDVQIEIADNVLPDPDPRNINPPLELGQERRYYLVSMTLDDDEPPEFLADGHAQLQPKIFDNFDGPGGATEFARKKIYEGWPTLVISDRRERTLAIFTEDDGKFAPLGWTAACPEGHGHNLATNDLEDTKLELPNCSMCGKQLGPWKAHMDRDPTGLDIHPPESTT